MSNGYPDAAVLLAHSSASWETPPAVLAGAVLAAVLFAQAFVRLRERRPDHAPWSRALLFGAGLALLVLPLVSPLDGLGDEDDGAAREQKAPHLQAGSRRVGAAVKPLP